MPTNIVPSLFSPLTIRGVTFRNRVAVAPMCQYSAQHGLAADWHLVHLGALASGGAGLVMTEATAVDERGRISPDDLGLWNDGQVDPLVRVTRFIREQGASPAIQLAHAGRKAGTAPPWRGGQRVPLDEGGWVPVGPTAIPFHPGEVAPHALSGAEIAGVIEAFAAAARRAVAAGFEVVEIHGAHGYLIHQFLSPLVNNRPDDWGGSAERRARLLLEIAAGVRAAIPEEMPLFVRLSCVDWHKEGLTVDDIVALAPELKRRGVDLVDCSSGGAVPGLTIPAGPGYQVPMARQIRDEGGIATGAVGLITEPDQADAIIRAGDADLVLLGRELLRDPFWPVRAAKALGQPEPVPKQYLRGW